MQLKPSKRHLSKRHLALPLGAIVIASATALLHAQQRVTLGTSVFSESRGPFSTLVVAPRVGVDIGATDSLRITGGYDVDVVSAASLAVIDSPADIDGITSATWMQDVRHSGRIGAQYVLDDTTLRAGYRYGTENDYRAHSPSLSVGVDLFERASRLEVALGGSFDEICDAQQRDDAPPQEREALGSSAGCFTDARASQSLTTWTLDASWTQAIRPDLAVQLILSGSRSEGFQSSPYREVWLGPWSAQESHPLLRHRGSAAVDVRLSLPAIRSVLGMRVRGYADDWMMVAASADLSLDVSATEEWRVRLHGRAYTQSGVAFYADDYVITPRGQYFTGDRELSPMTSMLGGARVMFNVKPNAEGRVLDALSGLRFALGVDVARADYAHYALSQSRFPDGFWALADFSVSGEIE